MEVLTTLLVILTIIQPFICLHPVIIWSQDSQHNSTFLVLIILIWFLPLGIHIVMKSILNQGLQRCKEEEDDDANDIIEEGVVFRRPKRVKPKVKPKIDSGLKKPKEEPEIQVIFNFS